MEIIKRDLYVNWLWEYKDKKIIKIITGLRRVGKSTILELFSAKLLENGVLPRQILKINFEELDNIALRDKLELHKYITSKKLPNEVLYILLDEVQRVDGFEEVVDSLFAKDGFDLYITGSNAKFLSSEIATVLTGRYIEVNVLPLSFAEYYSHFHSAKNDRRTLFSDYITYGAMPGIFMFTGDQSAQREYLTGVFQTIFEKDIMKRNSAFGKQISESILKYIMYNIGCLTSVTKITAALNAGGVKVSNNTIAEYLDTLCNCYFAYKAERFDVVGKAYLQQINKYYTADFGFKYYILNNETLELSQILENLVFLELKRRRYKLATGKVKDKEVDFIVNDKNGGLIYIQVAVTVMTEEKLNQELSVFGLIKDNYPKYIITLDDYFTRNHDGIITINALDFLLGEEL